MHAMLPHAPIPPVDHVAFHADELISQAAHEHDIRKAATELRQVTKEREAR